jgi:5-deoxy-glucuronate isomerase
MALIGGGPPRAGYWQILGPGDSELEYIGFGLLSLGDGESWDGEFPGREAVLVVLGGRCDVEAGERSWAGIGERGDVFDGKATAVYVPAGCRCRVTGRGEVELAVASAPAAGGGEATIIGPGRVGVREVGEGAFQREVHDILGVENFGAERLLVGETYNRPGQWSGYPPHKHDAHRPGEESKLEEVYHFRLRPPEGFGLQRVYGEGFDEAYAVQDRDAAVIRRGYHAVAAAPGYELYYLWVLAGEERGMRLREDPKHFWVSAQS